MKAIFTCPKCGAASSGDSTAVKRCAGSKADKTTHKAATMEIVDLLQRS